MPLGYLPAELVVQVAESEEDQPVALPACTNRSWVVPADRPLLVFVRPVCSTHSENRKPVRYFVAPDTAGHDHVIESASAVHETSGAAGLGSVVVQDSESVPDQPAAFPADTSSVS